ncbi:hypothetical protein D9615_003561 [Tricholomella constricta]|uniref:DNA repair metallo-beta-lactamase domain-containing protein n=1 Tax=Tricholomella constricta TaxID=117010 RepID=A0A8H5HI69_9AGAR|nr:hypothetical protein D9615_003561 [Tricholomella constricta]
MPSSKRKLQSTVTLHDFFSADAVASLKLRGKQKANPTHSPSSNVSQDNVIIIDSDSDSEPEVVQVIQTKRKRQRSLSSGGVEFVERDKRPASIANKASWNSKETQSRNGKAIRSSTLPDPSTSSRPGVSPDPKGNETPVYTFGSPTLLLNNDAATAATNATSTSKALSFGAPTLLLEPNSVSILSDQGASSASVDYIQNHTPSDEESMMDLGLSAEVTDDWGMGDDEAVFARPPDEVDEVGDISSDTSPDEAEQVTRCPSCHILLNGLSHLVSPSVMLGYRCQRLMEVTQELTRHVNDCLDSGPPDKVPSSSKAISAPQERFFQPLSTFSPPKVQGPMHLISCDGKSNGPGTDGNAFSVLMSSRKENEAWKEASVAEDRDFRPNKGNGGRRKAPFYKVLQGMPIAVDAFRYGTIPGVTAYFLTHAHSDHYTNLASNWKSGPIYCSEGTANLIIHMLSVDKKWVHPLPMDVPTVIPSTGGVRVTLIEANHCPGSCLFYFEGTQTVNAGDSAFKSPFVGSAKTFRYLHCGDFRASPRHVLHPAIKGKRIDHVYLDTTYLDPKYTFPPQPLVISACAELARKLVSGEPLSENPASIDAWRIPSNGNAGGKQKKMDKILIIVGTYSIGKERIVKAIANALQSKVYCDARKAAILRCQADVELDALLTSDPLEASVHLVPLGFVTSDKLKGYVDRLKGHFTKAVGFRPTGWTYTQPTGTDQMPSVSSVISRPHRGFTYANLRPARNSTPSLQLFPVPYSEHSSFFELTCFAMSFEWGKMIATVNVGSETSRGKMKKWVSRWEAERKKNGKDAIVPHRHIEYW